MTRVDEWTNNLNILQIGCRTAYKIAVLAFLRASWRKHEACVFLERDHLDSYWLSYSPLFHVGLEQAGAYIRYCDYMKAKAVEHILRNIVCYLERSLKTEQRSFE